MRSLDERTALLRIACAGSNLDDGELRALATEVGVSSAEPGEVLIAETGPSRQSFVIAEGAAALHSSGRSFAVVGPATFLDALAAETVPVGATAWTPMVLLVLAPSVVARLRRGEG